MSYKIEPREGVEVYVGQNGHVCIKQESMSQEEMIVVLHHEDIPKLIEYLEVVRQEALDFVPDPSIEGIDTQK